MRMSVCLREEGAVEVIHYSLIGGVPQSVTGRDLGVDNPLEVRGEVSDDPTATTDETDATSHGEDGVNARCWVYHPPTIFPLSPSPTHTHTHMYTWHMHTHAHRQKHSENVLTRGGKYIYFLPSSIKSKKNLYYL